MPRVEYKSNKKEVLKALAEAEERALLAIGLFVEGEAKVRTPVDTGNLRGSITHRVNPSERSVEIGTPTQYAVYVEKGTSRQSPQAFLTPAVEENKNRIKDLAKQMLGGLR